MKQYHKGEPSVAERYVVDKNNTRGAKFEDGDSTAALNLEEDIDDRGASEAGTSDVHGVRGIPAAGLSTGSATKTASAFELHYLFLELLLPLLLPLIVALIDVVKSVDTTEIASTIPLDR